MRPVGVSGPKERHPLDPAVGDVYGPDCGPCRDTWDCTDGSPVHCHCDYHDGVSGCEWGNAEFIKRLTTALESITYICPRPIEATKKEYDDARSQAEP